MNDYTLINEYYKAELLLTAEAMMAKGKGILAADESSGTIGKRFSMIDAANTVENRRDYRQLLFTTPGIEQYVSAAILYEETLFQNADNGVPFVIILDGKGIIPGIKVDMGMKELYNGEHVTQGLDNLDIRCKKYYAQGARFAKWRAVLEILDNVGATPSPLAIKSNSQNLARFAAICQANGLVPIVEPEVLCDGKFSIEMVEKTTEKVLSSVFKALQDHNVMLEGIILKPNMVRSGSDAPVQAWPTDIGAATLRVMKRTVPSAVKGIAFLSGGMSEDEATIALNAINYEGRVSEAPWRLTFSFGRALQKSCLKAWQGVNDQNHILAAQKAFLSRCKASGIASTGQNSSSEEALKL